MTAIAGNSDRLALAHRLWRVGAARVSTGNRVALLRNGPATFDAMLGRIAEARESVSLESYIIRSDAVGERFAPELLAAARRGVRTRVIFDWIGSRSTSRRFVHKLRSGGVDVRVFNRPSLMRKWFGFLPRDHRKLLVIDSKAGVVGGVGIGHEWTTGTHPGKKGSTPWRDTAVNIEGPAAEDMQTAFNRSWERISRLSEFDSDLSLPKNFPSADSLDAGGAMVAVMEGEPNRYRVTRALEATTMAAEKSIWISDAYFMANNSIMESLIGAARDGVDVRLLVPGRGDHPWMIRATRKYYPRLIRSGVRIWEWTGEMMHAKTGVMDGHYVRIGSTDFNPLGIFINFELDAMIGDQCLGASMMELFEEDTAQSTPVRS